MNVITASLLLFCASSPSNDRCDDDVALLQLNSKAGSSGGFSSSQVSLSPMERIGPNVHRHKLAFSEANATLSTTEPSYREFAGYWAGETDAAASSEHHEAPPTPSEAKAMLKRDPAIVGYSYEKSHPDVAYVKTSGSTFVPNEDWVSVARADDYWAKPKSALVEEASRKGALASLSLGESVEEPAAAEVFNWEDPPPDHAPLKALGHDDKNPPPDSHDLADPSLAPLKAQGHEDESLDPHEITGPVDKEDQDEEHEEPVIEEPEESVIEEPEEPVLDEVPEAHEEKDDAGSNATAPLVGDETEIETEHPGSLATGAALALLAAFCD